MLGTTKLTTANLSEPSGQRFFTSHCVSNGVPLIDACAKLAISPCAKGREIEIGLLLCAVPDVSDKVMLSPVGGGGGVPWDTVTLTVLELAVLPAWSVT
jgi:hypothetical protein